MALSVSSCHVLLLYTLTNHLWLAGYSYVAPSRGVWNSALSLYTLITIMCSFWTCHLFSLSMKYRLVCTSKYCSCLLCVSTYYFWSVAYSFWPGPCFIFHEVLTASLDHVYRYITLSNTVWLTIRHINPGVSSLSLLKGSIMTTHLPLAIIQHFHFWATFIGVKYPVMLDLSYIHKISSKISSSFLICSQRY